MIHGYSTNGFAHHRLTDACAIIAELGYKSVAITLESDTLDPPDRSGVKQAVSIIKPILDRTGLCVTIETGSRFILDPRKKHQPTLVSAALENRRRRVCFLNAAIDLAAELDADSVSLWSGAADDRAGGDEAMTRLGRSLGEVLGHAADRNVRLSFEPEPGMFIDSMARFAELQDRCDHPLLGLTLDVGHVLCMNDGSVAEHVARWRDRLWNVHIEDMRRGVHEHLMFGEGDMDFPEVFDALNAIDYQGPVHVELSRYSHNAVETARKSIEFLEPFVR